MSATPPIKLSWEEWGSMVSGCATFVGPLLRGSVGNAPWRLLGSVKQRREFLRSVAVKTSQAGGSLLSIRQLQYLQPSTRSTIVGWCRSNRIDLSHEEVTPEGGHSNWPDDPNPWINWIGKRPEPGSSFQGKLILYIHGGGFSMPMSYGHIGMMHHLMKEAQGNSKSYIYLASAEYTLVPYSQYPTQIRQCISIMRHLHSKYGVKLSNMVLVGDSGGGSIVASILSVLLHPSPQFPSLSKMQIQSASMELEPNSGPKPVPERLAGVLLISPLVCWATSRPSWKANAEKDAMPIDGFRRFRDAYFAGTDLTPPTPNDSGDAGDGGLGSRSHHIATLRSKVHNPISSSHRSPDPNPNTNPTSTDSLDATDPSIIGLEHGVGATRPPGSYAPKPDPDTEIERDDWWDGLDTIVKRIVITAGKDECFLDDIVAYTDQLRSAKLTQPPTQPPSQPGQSKATTPEIELVLDESFHAVLITEFNVGLPPGELAAKLSGWLNETLNQLDTKV